MSFFEEAPLRSATEHIISSATFYAWKTRFGDPNVSKRGRETGLEGSKL